MLRNHQQWVMNPKLYFIAKLPFLLYAVSVDSNLNCMSVTATAWSPDTEDTQAGIADLFIVILQTFVISQTDVAIFQTQ